MKNGSAGLQLALADAELEHCISIQDVDGAAPINESSGELALLWCCHNHIHHERITARVRHNARVIFWTPFYHTVRPAHPLLDYWHGGIDCLFSCSFAAFIIWLTGEYHVHAVLPGKLLPCIWWWGTWGWGWWRGTKNSSFSFAQLQCPVTLPSRVIAWLADPTVKLARCI